MNGRFWTIFPVAMAFAFVGGTGFALVSGLAALAFICGLVLGGGIGIVTALALFFDRRNE